ncbi:phosphatidylinositol transfer protein csr1 [Coemansia sp. RSA 1933]|nr:phosphatidylinositol transfer protein csr1 [Coemansia sp. RSA 1933]
MDKDSGTERPQMTLKEHYHNRIPHTEGRIGSLTAEQASKLQELWRLLLAEIERNERIPVRYSLTQPAPSGADYETTDVTALSFEPLETLSTKDKKPDEQSGAKGTQAKASGGSSWLFRWGGSSASTPEAASTGDEASESESGYATPASSLPKQDDDDDDDDEDEDEDEEAKQRRHETVQAYVDRAQADNSSSGGGIIPTGFKPLFGDPLGERTFRAAFWQAATQLGDPDSWVLRFLRARSWDVDEALQMISRTLVWRTGQAIDEVAYYGESVLHHHTMESGLAFACTRDNLDNPVYVVRVRVNFAQKRNIVAIKRFLCWQIETSQLLGGADGRVTILFDLSGFSRENIDLALVRTLITLLTNYYPETLGILILHVNSWVFSGIWSLISPFIDPAVKAKIVMARSAKDIAPFIDPSRLIAEVGGAKPFSYAYVLPSESENRCMADAEARQATENAFVSAVGAYEAATRSWLGGVSGSDADAARAKARDRLSQTAADLDPFIRSRTLYHRLGFINADHSVTF